jgi:hypothetical protein
MLDGFADDPGLAERSIGSRTKNPATIASGWPSAAHQRSSRLGSSKQTTDTRVLVSGWRTR